jgi:streptogramin lyase
MLIMASAVCAAREAMEYPVPKGSHPHDVTPAADGGVWCWPP